MYWCCWSIIISLILLYYELPYVAICIIVHKYLVNLLSYNTYCYFFLFSMRVYFDVSLLMWHDECNIVSDMKSFYILNLLVIDGLFPLPLCRRTLRSVNGSWRTGALQRGSVNCPIQESTQTPLMSPNRSLTWRSTQNSPQTLTYDSELFPDPYIWIGILSSPSPITRNHLQALTYDSDLSPDPLWPCVHPCKYCIIVYLSRIVAVYLSKVS